MRGGLIQELPPAARLNTAMLASRMAGHAPQSDAIRPLFEALATGIAGVLAGLNPTPAQVTLASLGIVTVDFDKLAAETVGLAGARGALRVRPVAQRDFDMLLCEAAFGGTGQMVTDPALEEDRPASHIERRLRAHVFHDIVMALAGALKQAGAGDLARAEEKPGRIGRGRLAASEAYVGRFLITMFSLSAEIEIEAERDALRDLMGLGGGEETGAAPAHEQLGLPGLSPCMVELSARLPRELMGFQRVASLQPGDLLELRATPTTVVEVLSGTTPLYAARLVPRAEGRVQLDITGAVA